jgi:hypothetical protein
MMNIIERYKRALPFIVGSWLAVVICYVIGDTKPIGAIGFAGILTIIPFMKHYWSQV